MKPVNDKIIRVIEATYGVLSDAAKKLKISRATLYNWIREDAELQEAVEDSRERLKDLTESKFIKHLLAGKEWAIRFSLQTLCKDRGYVPRVEQDATIKWREVQICMPYNGRDKHQSETGEDEEHG